MVCGLEIHTCHIPVDSAASGPRSTLVETPLRQAGTEGTPASLWASASFQTCGSLGESSDVTQARLAFGESAQHWAGRTPAEREWTVHGKLE